MIENEARERQVKAWNWFVWIMSLCQQRIKKSRVSLYNDLYNTLIQLFVRDNRVFYSPLPRVSPARQNFKKYCVCSQFSFALTFFSWFSGVAHNIFSLVRYFSFESAFTFTWELLEFYKWLALEYHSHDRSVLVKSSQYNAMKDVSALAIWWSIWHIEFLISWSVSLDKIKCSISLYFWVSPALKIIERIVFFHSFQMF